MKENADTSLPPVPEKKARAFIDEIITTAIEGKGPLAGAEEIARFYISDENLLSPREKSRALIRREASKNFGSGFITGLGGAVTLPVTIPASLFSSWVLQARMSAAIALVYGYDLGQDNVRTMILLSVLGDSGKEVLKKAGISLTGGMLQGAVKKIPARALADINSAVGFRLLARGTETGAVNLTKMVPVAGGILGGLIDAVSCAVTGLTAEKYFQKEYTGAEGGGKEEAAAETGGRREIFPIMITTAQLKRVLAENTDEISSVTIPGKNLIAIKPSLIPFSIRFRLVSFNEGVAKLKIEGNPLIRQMTRHRLGEVIDSLPGDFRKCLYLRDRLIIINLPVLLRDILNIRGIEVKKIAIIPEGVGIHLC